jgi:type IV secretion system protein VirD4
VVEGLILKSLGINTANPTVSNIMLIIFFASCIIPLYITIQKIIRHILKRPDFNFISLFKTREHFKLPKELKTGKGVIFGKIRGKTISKPENLEGHTLVIGGAGSGKSTCIAIPTLLNWTGHILAIDLKGELSKITGTQRKNIKIFNPQDVNSYTYNPLQIQDGNRVQNAQAIAKAVIPMPVNIKDPYWITSAQNLFTSAVLHYADEKDFPDLVRKIQGTPIDTLIEILANSEDEDSRLFANPLSGLKTETSSGIFTELTNNIVNFATDKDLQSSLRKSNYSIDTSDLDNSDIFIQIPEDKLDIWKNLLTLIITQFLRSFEKRPEYNDKPVLLLLDEFARLGKIEGIINALSTLRSKNIHIMILTQSLAQLDAIYGKDSRKIIADNCSYKVILKATDAETQEYFSKLVGTHEVKKQSHNSSYDTIGINKGHGQSTAEQEKRIIKPEEFAYLEKPVLFTPYGFYRPQKAPYYDE